jgi:hypothetical protein
MPHASNLSFLGIAKETTPGTPVTATAFIPVTAPAGKDALTLLDDKGMRGSMVDTYGQVAGVKSGTMDFGGDVFPDTIGWPLAGVLGDVATTGASAPYTHTMAVQNANDGQPKSYTLVDYYATATRAYPGAKISEFGLKFSADGMLTYTAKATTYGSQVVTKPTPSFTSVPPLASWIGTVTLGGSALTTVTDGELTIKRPVTVIDTVNGSQNPSQLWSGPVSVDGKLTVVMEDDSQLTNYLSATDTTLAINFAGGAGVGAFQVQFTMSKVKYSAAEIGRGKDYVELAITFAANANVTDIGVSAGYSPIKATLQNAIATGVFA